MYRGALVSLNGLGIGVKIKYLDKAGSSATTLNIQGS